MLYKRGGVWWYEFVFKGERIRESSKVGNRRVAEQIEAARKTQLAKGEVGIQHRKPATTLKEFAPRFVKAVEIHCAEKPLTVEFYKAKLKTLLADQNLASRRLDMIDECVVERYVQARCQVRSRRKKALAPASINRELATLRRLLHLAHEWKEISLVPRIRLLRGERNRNFVLSHTQEPAYLAVCPAPLADVAILLLDTGLRLGEAVSLEWPEVKTEPAQGAKFGYLTVLSGKAKNRKSRNVPLSERAVAMLRKWQPAEHEHVFHREDGSPLTESHLDQQHARVPRTNEMARRLRATFITSHLRYALG
jgi:integrase